MFVSSRITRKKMGLTMRGRKIVQYSRSQGSTARNSDDRLFDGPLGARSRAVLFLNAFFTGAAVMGFEMLVSRFLTPWFGSGIQTWAALIAVALLALCVGYFAGGQIADRAPMLMVLAAINFVAGAFILAVPEFAAFLCEQVSGTIVDVRAGALLAATVLMFVPFALLGMYTPFAIRLGCRDR